MKYSFLFQITFDASFLLSSALWHKIGPPSLPKSLYTTLTLLSKVLGETGIRGVFHPDNFLSFLICEEEHTHETSNSDQ